MIESVVNIVNVKFNAYLLPHGIVIVSVWGNEYFKPVADISEYELLTFVLLKICVEDIKPASAERRRIIDYPVFFRKGDYRNKPVAVIRQIIAEHSVKYLKSANPDITDIRIISANRQKTNFFRMQWKR